MPTTSRPRQSADQRREALVEAALPEFAMNGLHGTAVSAITDRVGITQPYAFSLFGTKKGLFLAAVEHGFDRTEETFRAAAASAPPADRLQAMGQAYGGFLRDHRDLLLVQLQAYAACDDEEVRTVVRRRFVAVHDLVRDLSGAGEDELLEFFKTGMLLNVVAALDLPAMAFNESWMAACRADPSAVATAGGGSPPG
jgi:AcrR family transcriptional regulator